MIHNREQLINWLINNSTKDILLQNAFRHPGTRVELLGTFNPLPGGLEPGWLVRIITYRGREDLIAVVQDHLDRPCRWYVTDHVSWDTWQGPSEDVLIGGDKKMIPFPNKKYQIIYADPPWSYNDKRDKHPRMCGGALSHYNTMSLTDIKTMPLSDIVADNAVLFLWVTFPLLKEGMEVLEAWGFKYKTLGFSWIKLNKKNGKPFFGIGYYTKSNCECCILGVKGKTIKPAVNVVSSVILSPRREHSRKPIEAKQGIELLYPTQARIELFARQKTPGWDVWGDEVCGDEDGKEKESTGRFDRIKRCAPVCIEANWVENKHKAGPPVVKKKTHPPGVSAK